MPGGNYVANILNNNCEEEICRGYVRGTNR